MVEVKHESSEILGIVLIKLRALALNCIRLVFGLRKADPAIESCSPLHCQDLPIAGYIRTPKARLDPGEYIRGNEREKVAGPSLGLSFYLTFTKSIGTGLNSVVLKSAYCVHLFCGRRC